MVEYCGTILVGCMPSFPRFFLHLQGKDAPNSTSSFGSNGPGVNGSNSNQMRHVPSGSQSGPRNTISPAPTPGGPRRPSPIHSRNKSIAASVAEDYHSAIMHSRSDSGVSSIGIAITTSEVSLADPACVDLESGLGSRQQHVDPSPFSARGSGIDSIDIQRNEQDYDDADWSPLSSPR